MNIKMIYKNGNEWTIKGIKDYNIDLVDNAMYYTVDEVYFVGGMPIRRWPLENIAEIGPVADEEVKA